MKSRFFCAALAVGLSLSCVASNAQQAFQWTKFKGQTITVALAKQPWSDFITPRIREFEKITGINVTLEVLPEDQNRQKLAIAFASGNRDIDVFGSQHHNEGAKYQRAGWYEALGPYITDKALTSPDFDFGDFAPQAITDATVAGDLVGIPLYTELEILMFRKDLLEAAGLRVPATLDQLGHAADVLTNKKGQYGICMRGKGAATTTVFSGYLHSMGGSWADTQGNPALASPAAIKAFQYYGRLTREDGPPGGVNYHWLQCQSLMASGKAAMWTDSNIFAATLLNQKKSPVADKFGFAVFPAGPGGRKPAGGGWYLSIYSKSQHKQAAWLFVQWAISKQNALAAQLSSIPTARLSAWQSPEFRKQDKAPELTQATLDSLKLKDTPSWGPPWVAVGEIRDVIGAVVVTAIQGGDIKRAAEKCDAQIREIRAKTEQK